MTAFIIVSMVSGLLFGTMDGLLNANPLARKLNEVYKPIAKTNLNLPAGIIIDLAYGFIMAGVFVILYEGLPLAGLVKGLGYGLMVWFFRVVMSTASGWMMYKIPVKTLLYNLSAGLVEMLVLGLIYGGFLKPWT
jgi:uncharacterized membrane protein YagU involved in acid resistance